MNHDRQQARALRAILGSISPFARSCAGTAPTPAPTAAQLGHQLGQVLRALEQPSGMAGLELKLRYKDREYVRER